MTTMNKVRRATGGLGLAVLAGCSGAVGAAGAPATWSSTRTVEVTDPQYQTTAFTVLVPSGWKSAAEITRKDGCHGTGAGLNTTMRSPDGSVTIAHLPGVRWTWSSSELQREHMASQHCAAVDINSASSFLLNIAIPNLQPGAAITAILPLDDAGQASISKQLAQAKQNSDAAFARYHVPAPKLIIDGARVRIRYADHGKLMEEQVQTIIDCNESTTQAMYKLPSSTTRNCSARNFYVVSAPQGQLTAVLDSPALAKLNAGIAPNMDWYSKMSDDLRKQTQSELDANRVAFAQFMRQAAANQQAMLERGRQFQQQEQTQFEHAQALDRNNQAAIDQAAHGTVLVSLGRKDYRNPETGQLIEANAYYDHQWLSSDGSTLIQTDNPSLDPNGVVYPVSQSWTELEPK